MRSPYFTYDQRLRSESDAVLLPDDIRRYSAIRCARFIPKTLPWRRHQNFQLDSQYGRFLWLRAFLQFQFASLLPPRRGPRVEGASWIMGDDSISSSRDEIPESNRRNEGGRKRNLCVNKKIVTFWALLIRHLRARVVCLQRGTIFAEFFQWIKKL